MKAVFLDFATYYPQGLDVAALKNAVPDFTFYDHTDPTDVTARIQNADIILTNKVVLDRDIIANAPDLKLIIAGATGYNNIDVDAARDCGVTVCNVRDYSTPAVSQHTFMLILALRSQIMKYHTDVKAGRWQDSRDFCFLDYPIHELQGQTLGIYGYGNLGRNVESIARAFGMEVLIAARKGEKDIRAGRAHFDDVVKTADIHTLHCPFTDETRNMIAAAELSTMKRSALLINTARGGIVNEGDLAEALKSDVIAGAGVDVLSQEPPNNGNPLLAADIPNIIVTPHVAWASRQACQRLFDQLVKVIDAYKNGVPMNVVS
ncbi:MAG: D-2-hydroxyacid dehydrogenase [Bdellovibrionales bacterium]